MTGKHRDQAVALFQQIAQYIDGELCSLDELICIKDGGTDSDGNPRAFLFVSIVPNTYAASELSSARVKREQEIAGHHGGEMPPEIGWNRGNGTPYELAERMAIELMRVADKKRAEDVR